MVVVPDFGVGEEPLCLTSHYFNCSECYSYSRDNCPLLHQPNLLHHLRFKGHITDPTAYPDWKRQATILAASEKVLVSESKIMSASEIELAVYNLFPDLHASYYEIGVVLKNMSSIAVAIGGGSYFAGQKANRPELSGSETKSTGNISNIDPGLVEYFLQDLKGAPRLSKNAQINFAWTYQAYRFVRLVSEQFMEQADTSFECALVSTYSVIDQHTRDHELHNECVVDQQIHDLTQFDPHEVLGRAAKAVRDPGQCNPIGRYRDLQVEGLNARNLLALSQVQSIWNTVLNIEFLQIDILELFQEAFLRVMRAVESFDPSRGAAFSQYVGWYIRVALDRATQADCRQIRIPIHRWDTLRELGLLPTAMDMGPVEAGLREISGSIDMGPTLLSLERDLSQQRVPSRAGNTIAQSEDDEILDCDPIANWTLVDEPEVTNYLERVIIKDNIAQVLDTLTDREQKVLRLRFGIGDDVNRTLEEVGGIFGVTRERIRQIESKALKKLRHPTRARYLVGEMPDA